MSQIPDAERKSSEASSDLTTVIGTASAELIDLPGRDGASISKTNPDITEALARAIGPQLFAMTGGDEREIEFAGANLVDKEEFVGAFAVMGTSAEAFKTMSTQVMDAESLIFQSYGRAHHGDPKKYVPPHRYIASMKMLEEGVRAMAQNSVFEMLAEGRTTEAWTLTGYDIMYEPGRSFFHDRPVRKTAERSDVLRPIPNETMIVRRSDNDGSRDDTELKKELDALVDSEEIERVANSFAGRVETPRVGGHIAQLSMLSTIPPRRFSSHPDYTDELAAQMSDLTTMDISTSSTPYHDVIFAFLFDMSRPFFMYDDYVDSEDFLG